MTLLKLKTSIVAFLIALNIIGCKDNNSVIESVAEKNIALKTEIIGSSKPHDSILRPGSLVFMPSDGPVNLNNQANWWYWTIGANWQHPQGPDSNILDKKYLQLIVEFPI